MTRRQEKKSQAKPQPRYYGLVPEHNVNLGKLVESALIPNSSYALSSSAKLEADLKSAQTLWNSLKDGGRITSQPHVTITHSKERRTEESVWIACENIVKQAKQAHHQVLNRDDVTKTREGAQSQKQAREEAPEADTTRSRAKESTSSSSLSLEFDVTDLVWNDRVMALVIQNLRATRQGPVELGTPSLFSSDTAILGEPSTSNASETKSRGKKQGKGKNEGDSGEDVINKFLSELPNQIKNRLHITVGTRDNSVPAVEAKELVRKWRLGEAGEDVKTIPLQGIILRGQIRGLMG